MALEMKLTSPQVMEDLSDAWCNTAIQVFQPAPLEKLVGELKTEDGDLRAIPQVKFDDLKSWLWLQQAIHPELDYEIGFRKKWFSPRINPNWKGISIKKWVKEIRQKRKEKDRLQRAEVHAAMSVARLAASLAAIAAENAIPNRTCDSKETAVAAAAALLAAQCAQVAEAVGAHRELLESEMSNAMTATDANNIVTLTAAAATSLRGAATLKGRPCHKEKIKSSSSSTPITSFNEHDFDFGRCKASLAKGEELIVRTPDGNCRLRLVSILLNIDAKVILKMKKTRILMSFSSAQESTVYDMQTDMLERQTKDQDSFYSVHMSTSEGKIELKIRDYVQYKKWSMTINQMLMLSTTFSAYELQFYRN
ncbi:hypothetical protein J5N97_001258 [Dioscorea zingiberensis]|uniref:VAN3-binding protein n=1 Tax=Dioscorea zingiberensis TaxID=325984 RepID=A0A9D5BUB1_9LILI|nr:hypothetical protein J5N97_001258 [Dioscorea zingiberensis]